MNTAEKHTSERKTMIKVKRPTRRILGMSLMKNDDWVSNGHWALSSDRFKTKLRAFKDTIESSIPASFYGIIINAERVCYEIVDDAEYLGEETRLTTSEGFSNLTILVGTDYYTWLQPYTMYVNPKDVLHPILLKDGDVTVGVLVPRASRTS